MQRKEYSQVVTFEEMDDEHFFWVTYITGGKMKNLRLHRWFEEGKGMVALCTISINSSTFNGPEYDGKDTSLSSRIEKNTECQTKEQSVYQPKLLKLEEYKK